MTQPSMSEYEYWSGRPIDNEHKIFCVPQSVADGWQAFCSCGKWKSFKSFYDFPTRESIVGVLNADHANHVAQCQHLKNSRKIRHRPDYGSQNPRGESLDALTGLERKEV